MLSNHNNHENSEIYIKREDLKRLSEIHKMSENAIKNCLLETSKITNYPINKVIQYLDEYKQPQSFQQSQSFQQPFRQPQPFQQPQPYIIPKHKYQIQPQIIQTQNKSSQTYGRTGRPTINITEVDHFMAGGININIDDQQTVIVPFNKQEYVNRDFSKIVLSRFPRFNRYSYKPKKFGFEPHWVIQREIDNKLKEGVNWTNQTLSYARTEIVGQHMISCIIIPLITQGLFESNKINVVDATSNIGADSITFGLETFVTKVSSYEIFEPSYKMLQNNIKLYGLDDKVFPMNKRFDYDAETLKNAIVVIDPPYESSYNSTLSNFNLSIDTTPIYNVAQKCLDAGARCVLLSMPKTYKYNKTFAEYYDQHVTVYQMGKKNNKLFLVMRNEDGHRLKLPQFKYYRIVSTGARTEDGKFDPYKCKKI